MKKLMISTALLGISLSIQAKECEIPIGQIEVGSVKLMQSYEDFKKIHPQWKRNKNAIELDTNQNLDSNFSKVGVSALGFIDYSAAKNKIIAYSLAYSEGTLANYDTPINTFKNKILSISNLPKSGWVLNKKKDTYQYTCKDYKISIIQDHGTSQGALGPTVWVSSKYSDSFNY